MNNLRFIYLMLFLFGSQAMFAHINPFRKQKLKRDRIATIREECKSAVAQIDQEINNVRARLLTGGDVWWDLTEGKYIVPKTQPGDDEVSSMFAASVWLGGLDEVGNLKIAAVDYRNGGQTDYYSGPIDPNSGATDLEICQDWDQFFKVLAVNVEEHNKNFDIAQVNEQTIDPSSIPDDVRYWPAKGNPYFADKFEFELPNTGQGLGSFWDEDGDENYDPVKGDFPIIDIRGCEPVNRAEAKELVPDEMIFWIYNDAGGPHTLTQGTPILMEVQVQAFAFTSNDEINDMTFQRYKLINRASSDITNCYFAMWIDPDLGCHTDDYLGCDIERSLAYVYNEDALDGQNGCTCDGGVNTYCDEVPILGIDYFRGPLAPRLFDEEGNPTVTPPLGSEGDTLIELGMSSFVYYNNAGVGEPNTNTTDPTIDVEYYNYLRGLWRTGVAFTDGGDGFNSTSTDTVKYAFPNPPNESGWSMCEEDLPFGDRRMLQASGPFLLKPQAVNELIIGVAWVPDLDYPCPDISRLLFADDLAQSLFDNCFEIKDGPDAPDVDVIELDRELVLILTNDNVTSNNKFESYEEEDLNNVDAGFDSLYRFEGYQIFQLADASVTAQELNNINKARLVRQADIKNGIQSLYNWKPAIDDPTPNSTEIVWTFEKKVEAMDQGLAHTFRINEDEFAEGDRRMINHREYYYMVLAYAHNNWKDFDPSDGLGQRSPYCAGRRNIKVTTVVPRPIVYENQNASYGDGAIVTRIEGQGTGGVFLDMAEEMYDKILDGSADGIVKYKEGAGPLDIKVYNPLEVKNGNFRLSFTGDFRSGSTCGIQPGARWVLEEIETGKTIAAETSIDILNEQIISDYGFTVSIGQSDDAGDKVDESNGVIGSRISYPDPATDPWLGFIPDDAQEFYNYLRTASNEEDNELDPTQAYSTVGDAAFVPFVLADFRSDIRTVSPGWKDFEGGQGLRSKSTLAELNNVDIVFTSDKSKWSRCVIVETSNAQFKEDGFENIGNVDQFDLRDSPSVGLDDSDGDGRPDPDGDGVGMGYFPGYAVDVETGERLNIFFGENSMYNEDLAEFLEGGVALGSDMMYNPSSEIFTEGVPGAPISLWNFVTGGQHHIYVTRQEYDGCAQIRARLGKNFVFTFKRDALKLVTWAGIPILPPGLTMRSYADGLVPGDGIVKLRVDNPYNREINYGISSELFSCDAIGELPVYEFEIAGKESTALEGSQRDSALAMVNVVPNPYFAYSDYERSRLDNVVKITNLPARATVTIFSLDGKFIKQFKRDERGVMSTGRTNPGIRSSQVIPDIEWDLKNSKGIAVASGVYLIHVAAPDLGSERTIKWFGINRKFDPAGL